MAFGDEAKLGSSNRITFGDLLNDCQDGAAFYAGTSSGSSNNYVMNFGSGLSPNNWTAGQRFYFIADKANSGAITIQIGGVTKALYDVRGASQISLPNAIRAGDLVEFFYDGTQCRLIGATSTKLQWKQLNESGGITIAAATITQLTTGTISLTVRTGEAVLLLGMANYSIGTLGADLTLAFTRDGTEITQNFPIDGPIAGTSGYQFGGTLIHVDTPSPGTYQYALGWRIGSGTGYGLRRRLIGIVFDGRG